MLHRWKHGIYSKYKAHSILWLLLNKLVWQFLISCVISKRKKLKKIKIKKWILSRAFLERALLQKLSSKQHHFIASILQAATPAHETLQKRQCKSLNRSFLEGLHFIYFCIYFEGKEKTTFDLVLEGHTWDQLQVDIDYAGNKGKCHELHLFHLYNARQGLASPFVNRGEGRLPLTCSRYSLDQLTIFCWCNFRHR